MTTQPDFHLLVLDHEEMARLYTLVGTNPESHDVEYVDLYETVATAWSGIPERHTVRHVVDDISEMSWSATISENAVSVAHVLASGDRIHVLADGVASTLWFALQNPRLDLVKMVASYVEEDQ